MRRSVAALALAVVAVGFCACAESADSTQSTADDGSVTITDAWSRQPASGQTTAAVYGLVTNRTGAPVTVVSASSPVADSVMLHETLIDDAGTMSMEMRPDGFEIAPGETLAFEPGGAHIMLLGIDSDNFPGVVGLTLTLDDGESVSTEAEVRPLVDGPQTDTSTTDPHDVPHDHGGSIETSD